MWGLGWEAVSSAPEQLTVNMLDKGILVLWKEGQTGKIKVNEAGGMVVDAKKMK